MSSENLPPKESASEVVVHDPVNHPSHYTRGAVEAIDAIRSALGDPGFTDYCIGNCIKYAFRWQNKGGVEDLRKAAWYLNEAIKTQGA